MKGSETEKKRFALRVYVTAVSLFFLSAVMISTLAALDGARRGDWFVLQLFGCLAFTAGAVGLWWLFSFPGLRD